MKIFTIAYNTFRETIRDRVLRVILGLSLFMILVSSAIGAISAGEDNKVIIDFSLGAIDLFSVVLCVFVGTGLIYKEIDKKTLYLVISRPLARWQFIIGKYLGMCMTLAVSIAVMGGVFCVYLVVIGVPITWTMFAAISLIFLGVMLLNAFATLFSTLASPTVSAISTVVIFLVGRSTEELKFLLEIFRDERLRKTVLVVYYSLPNFSNFNIKWQVVHNLPVDTQFCLWSILYCLCYSGFVLYFSCLFFHKRNF